MTRRAFIMLAVLVVVSGAVLAVIGMLWLVRADVAGAATMEQSAQSRCLAWSGLQTIATELDGQRDRILAGLAPTIDRQFVLYEAEDRLGVVRLFPADSAGESLAPQAGRLDLNHATAESLAATGMVNAELASAIVAHRDGVLGGSFQSEVELLGVPGITAELLYGPLERLTDDWQRAAEASSDDDRDLRAGEVSEQRGLLDVCTVYGFEPALQRSGVRRINMNVPWSDELGRRLDERFGQGASEAVKALYGGGTTIDSEVKLLSALQQLQVPADRWGEVLDAVTTSDGELLGGRLDLNTASYEALLALPGMTPPEAASIVRAREALSDDERGDVTWPLQRELLTPERYEAIASRVTVRSWCWRVRLVAGEVMGADADGPLASPVAWEAVIDLTSPVARLAYLREITLLPVAAVLLLDQSVANGANDSATPEAAPAPIEEGSATSDAPGDADAAVPSGDDDQVGSSSGDPAADGASAAPSPTASAKAPPKNGGQKANKANKANKGGKGKAGSALKSPPPTPAVPLVDPVGRFR
ncbi:MAG: helix-hairpin-helix domain-containing protein [Phycisphaerales bacterium]|nr:helix-hairpin-helix domain-containing protein [Phycisphaerales bacterium]